MGAAKKISENVSEAELVSAVSKIISGITGVQLGEKQYSLVQGRLSKRMRELRVTTPKEYVRHFNAHEDIETGVLTSLMTTHHTYFFREFSHFEFLLNRTLPKIVASHKEKGLDTIRIWSAACSRGQEVYSLAMFLNHHLPQIAPGMKFEIVGSDVCEESVALARNGVYTWDEVKTIPAVYLNGNWTKGTGEIANYVRAKETVRKKMSFRSLNLIELDRNPFGLMPQKFDVIFCRNVFIYFSHEQIKSIVTEFLKVLNPIGHIFVGLSESLNGLHLPMDWVGPSVYVPTPPMGSQKVIPLHKSSSVAQAMEIEHHAPAVEPQCILRVLCVDDSPTVLTLLKKILKTENGFEVVGTAKDGGEAAEKAKALRPDVITLDIHMPNVTGVDYLQRFHSQINIPVVMVSSVSRDDSALAFKALELGASDYIEKPSLANLPQVEEELLFKLRAAFDAGKVSKGRLSLDASFKRSPVISNIDKKLRVIVANFASRDNLVGVLKELHAPQPPTLVLVDGARDLYEGWASKVTAQLLGARASNVVSLGELTQNSFTFMEYAKGIELLKRGWGGLDVSICALGPYSKNIVRGLTSLVGAHLVIEDLGSKTPTNLATKADQVVPVTSFAYESNRYFEDGRMPK